MIKLTKTLVDAGIFSLVITGGEPLTRPNLTLEIVSIVKKIGISVSINTNLLLLTQWTASELKKIKVDSLLVSCPASDPDIYQKITGGDIECFKSKLNKLHYELKE